MGAFLLCKKEISPEKIEAGLHVFQEKGFGAPMESQMGDYRLFLYRKLMISENNIRIDGPFVLAAIGTPVYKGKTYSKSLDAIFEDLKSSHFKYTEMYGSYILLFYDGMQIQFVFDDMKQLPVYSSDDGAAISSSFLACAKTYNGTLSIDKLACLEKLCTGMITGNNTLFKEISRSLPENLNGYVEISTVNDRFEAKRKGQSLKSETQKQLTCLNEEIDEISSLVSEYGADMGLSGGYDSRLMYGMLQSKHGDKLSVHTHCTKGAHEKEIRIATQLADMYHKKLNICPTVPLQSMNKSEAEETLKTNIYLFDGYSDSHYGTFSSTYSKEYRRTVCDEHLVFFTGVSGEIYRNYRKISKPVFTKEYFDTYVFYCHYQNVLKSQSLVDSLRQYVMNKAFLEMGKEPTVVMNPEDVRRYNACVRLPYKASCASSAFNQLCFYDAPCSHRAAIIESMAADHVVGDDCQLESEMILSLDKRFEDVPVAKVDTSSIGKPDFITTIKRFIYSRLPMSVVRRRKLINTETAIGEQIVKQSKWMQEAVNYTKRLMGQDISLDCLIGNKNSYQNTVFSCSVLYGFKDQIRIE